RGGREPLETFEEGLAAEEQRRADNWAPMWHYRHAGFYAESVRSYIDAFGRGRVQVVLHDDMDAALEPTFRALFRALDVDPDAPVDFGVQHNQSGTPRSVTVQRLVTRAGPVRKKMKKMLPAQAKRAFERFRESNVEAAPDMAPTTRAELTDYFADDIRKL